MAFGTELFDLEHDSVQRLTKEAVKAALESPLREPILEAVEDRTGSAIEPPAENGTVEPEEKSHTTKAIQGGIVFVVMFVVLYVTLRRLTGDEA